MAERRAVKKAILEGVQLANKRYERWSGGWWLTDSGVEGHAVSTIGEMLSRKIVGKGSVVMEMPFGTIEEWSGAGRPLGRPRKTLNESNRADIVVLDRRDRPVYVIEVKRFWTKKPCFEDLQRIRDLLLKFGCNAGGSLVGGFLVFMLAGWKAGEITAEQRLRAQAKEIRRLVRGELDTEGLDLTCYLGGTRKYPKKYRDLLGETNWVHAGFRIELRS